MSEQYVCAGEHRRDAVRDHPTLNGIDYLEVVDGDAPAGSPRQRTLLVRCLKPVALDERNVRIEGGVRIAPIAVVWAGPASAPPAGATADEQAFLAALTEPDHVLAVRTDAAGDFSTYTLFLQVSPTDPSPPAGFDPLLSEVEFGFKVECPSDFDCAPPQTSPPETGDEPAIDYLARDYSSFRRLLLDRMALLVPGWSERSPADVGVALVELLAYAGDYLSYYQDAVATEAYLGTARRRVSVRRHVRLLDYPMHDGCNARAFVVLVVTAGSAADASPLTAPAQVLTKVDAPRGTLRPAALAHALTQAPVVFETLHDLTPRAAHNQVSLYTWGDDRCCLPRGATGAALVDDGDVLQLAPGDLLVLEERLGPESGLEADADPTHRHAVRLTAVEPFVDPLNDRHVLRVEWDAADALPFPLCVSTLVTDESGEHLVEDVSVARGNVVLVDHGRTFAGEALPAVPASGRYRPVVPRPDLTFRVPFDALAARSLPAAEAVAQEPRAALPALSLELAAETWTPQRDLLGSDRFAPELVAEVEQEGTATLRFGDDVFGRRPPAGAAPVATYRVGNGAAGNVGAGALAHVVAAQDGIVDVRNPLPAAGGVERESLEEARLYAPQAFRTQERAVTEDDYAAVAERHAEVQKAVATRRWTGSWHTMFVTVDRAGGRPVDARFRDDLRAFVERFRLAGDDLEIDEPRFVALDVALTVCAASGYFASDVERAVLDALSAFFRPDNLTFGQPVYLSAVVAVAMDVPGVAWVDVTLFQRFGEAPRGELDAGRIALARLEIARLDNDPSRPENGRLRVTVEGGL